MNKRFSTSFGIAAAGILIAGAVWAGVAQPWQEESGRRATGSAVDTTAIGPGDEAVLASERARRTSTAEVLDIS